MKLQNGQTLIETMVAIFVMVMGITAALGLASYSLNASTGIRKQIIGMGLAREGMEAVKNMRDTNWLNGQLNTDCFNYSDSTSTGRCYRDWLNPTPGPGYVLAAGNYFLGLNAAASASNGYWITGSALGNPWGLNNSSDINNGLYTPSATSSSSSGFYRRITITSDVTAPFDYRTGSTYHWPRLLVQTQVWWTDKSCPGIGATWPGPSKCSIQLQSYLTNWKTY